MECMFSPVGTILSGEVVVEVGVDIAHTERKVDDFLGLILLVGGLISPPTTCIISV